MLVSDIVRRVRESVGDIAVLQFSNATLTDWINDGIREIVVENSLLQARATSDTVVDQKEYTLPVDIFKLHSVWIDGCKIQTLTLEEFEERTGGDNISTGGAYWCYIYAGVLNLWPTPDTIVPMVVNYTKLPVTIVYSADPEGWVPTSPSIAEAFHNRIVTYCLAQVAMQDDDYAKYQALMLEFQTGVVSLKHTKDQEEDLYPSISISLRDQGDSFGGYYA